MGQPTYHQSCSMTVFKCSKPSVRFPTNINSDVAPSASVTQNKKKTACYPLATPVCVKLVSPPIPSRAQRTRRKDYKPRRISKPYWTHSLLTHSVQRPSVTRSTENANGTQFPSTPSEYAAYRAASNPLSTTNAPLTHAPLCTMLKRAKPHTIIPSLSLSLGLHRIPSSSLSSSTPGMSDNCMATPNRSAKCRRVSKSDMAEAQWWIRMYDSLAWHVNQLGSKTTHELVFLARLEAQIRHRWYPIVDKAQKRMKNHDESLVMSEAPRLVGVPLNDPATRQQKRMLCPTQLAAQAFLRRSHASERPLRRKRHASPGRSALRCEL